MGNNRGYFSRDWFTRAGIGLLFQIAMGLYIAYYLNTTPRRVVVDCWRDRAVAGTPADCTVSQHFLFKPTQKQTFEQIQHATTTVYRKQKYGSLYQISMTSQSGQRYNLRVGSFNASVAKTIEAFLVSSQIRTGQTATTALFFYLFMPGFIVFLMLLLFMLSTLMV